MGSAYVTNMQLSTFDSKQYCFTYLLLILTIQPFVHGHSFVWQSCLIYANKAKFNQLKFCKLFLIKRGAIWEAIVVKLFLLKFIWGQTIF